MRQGCSDGMYGSIGLCNEDPRTACGVTGPVARTVVLSCSTRSYVACCPSHAAIACPGNLHLLGQRPVKIALLPSTELVGCYRAATVPPTRSPMQPKTPVYVWHTAMMSITGPLIDSQLSSGTPAHVDADAMLWLVVAWYDGDSVYSLMPCSVPYAYTALRCAVLCCAVHG